MNYAQAAGCPLFEKRKKNVKIQDFYLQISFLLAV